MRVIVQNGVDNIIYIMFYNFIHVIQSSFLIYYDVGGRRDFDPCIILIYVYALWCDRIQILHPHCHRSITWHAPVTAWGEGNTSDLRAIRQTGTLKLLGRRSAGTNVASHF